MQKEHHIIDYKVFVFIWIILLMLTVVTFLVSRLDLGFLNIIVALTIASTKALLVILFFMHLKYESNLIRIMVFIAFLILAIFIGFTFFDVAYR